MSNCSKIVLFLLCFVMQVAMATGKQRVIYITLDGIAPVEMSKAHMPYFFSHIVPLGEMVGLNGDKRSMEVASIPISMPSYHSQMGGVVTDCDGNSCGRIKVETLPEKLVHDLDLTKGKVATFASWSLIREAVEHEEDTTYTNCGTEMLHLPGYDERLDKLNYQQLLHPGYGLTDRKDAYTFALGSIYLERAKPDFLWISLQDGDIFAHQNNRSAYLDVLKQYDENLKLLTLYLKDCDDVDNTWLVVTTDHGRGKGDDWTHHGPAWPESKKTWLFVVSARALRTGEKEVYPYLTTKKSYSTIDIKPMIESMMLPR